jgi:hypothetical protein
VPPEGIAEPFSEGRAVVTRNDGWGIIDTSGNTVVSFGREFDHVWSFSNGLAAVQQRGRGQGFIDTSGNIVVPIGYGGFMPFFREGLTSGTRDGQRVILQIIPN